MSEEKVLLVDDEKDFLEIMAERLSARGMEVHMAATATEALSRIQKESFDAVVMDCMMPGMDGIDALKAFKAKRPELQIILLTGHATIEKSVEAMKLGATDFLEKPADIDALTKKIKDAQARKMLIVEKNTADKVKEALRKYGI